MIIVTKEVLLCRDILTLEALKLHHGVVEPQSSAASAPGHSPPVPGLLSLSLLLTPGLGAGLSPEAAVTT